MNFNLNSPLYVQALNDCIHYHKRQSRKLPPYPNYAVHPISVATRAICHEEPLSIVIACLLHDVIEDTHCNKQYLLGTYGDAIYDLIEGCTEDKMTHLDKKVSWKMRKEAHIDKILAHTKVYQIVIVKYYDDLDNMQSMLFYEDNDLGKYFNNKLDETFDMFEKRFDLLYNPYLPAKSHNYICRRDDYRVTLKMLREKFL